jgi:RNA polymerase sigma-70 factor, ECF subfamily
MSNTDTLLVTRVRKGEPEAWAELIARFEGRLLAYIEARLGRRTAGEDVVQETFIGFLTSLPNYNSAKPLENWLFAIAAHKLTDHLRREGRRPALPLTPASADASGWELPGSARPASALVRSGERQELEKAALAAALAQQIGRWREAGEWQKIKCIELLVVRGWANKDVARELEMSEQAVANLKFDFIGRLSTLVRRQGLSEDVFPELKQND